jgi:hypothetical protein
MTSEGDPSALVAEVLTATDVDRDHVGRLLELLDVGDRQVRLGAATALCVVADEHPGAVASPVRPLAPPTGIRPSSGTGLTSGRRASISPTGSSGRRRHAEAPTTARSAACG